MAAKVVSICGVVSKNKRHQELHRMYDSQDGKCFYCRCKTEIVCNGSHGQMSNWFPTRATIEHRRPRSLGGGRGGNTVLACGGCNNKKGDKPVTVLLLPTFSHV